jgi:integrase
MRGHVYQRREGGTWTIVYDEGRREDGKRQQRAIGGYKRKVEAQEALTKKLHALREGSYVEPSKITLAEYLTDEWLPSITGNVRPATHTTYSSLVRTHIVKHNLGQQRLQALSPAQVKAFYAQLEQAGLSAETRRLIHSVLHKSLADAVGDDRLVRNPLDRVKRPKASTRRATAWTAIELRRFLAQTERDRLYALWHLAATTGMRRGECLGLTWRSLELDEARLLVGQQLRATRDFGPPKTPRSERTIALDPTTVETLKQHEDAQKLERALAGDAYQDQDLVFCDELGAPISPQWISGSFLAHRKASGLHTGTLHTLRHTAATLMLTNGIPLHVVAARLGDRPETLLRVYAHLLPQSDEGAAQGMERIVAGPTKGGDRGEGAAALGTGRASHGT